MYSLARFTLGSICLSFSSSLPLSSFSQIDTHTHIRFVCLHVIFLNHLKASLKPENTSVSIS